MPGRDRDRDRLRAEAERTAATSLRLDPQHPALQQYLRRSGLLAHWRAHGRPDVCRDVGDDGGFKGRSNHRTQRVVMPADAG